MSWPRLNARSCEARERVGESQGEPKDSPWTYGGPCPLPPVIPAEIRRVGQYLRARDLWAGIHCRVSEAPPALSAVTVVSRGVEGRLGRSPYPISDDII